MYHLGTYFFLQLLGRLSTDDGNAEGYAEKKMNLYLTCDHHETVNLNHTS